MKSLFNPSDNNEIVERINKLTSNSKALWGKMNVGQMLAHCQVPLLAAYGEVKTSRGLIGVLFGGFAKKKYITKDMPFEKNLPTDKLFVMTTPKEFEEQKSKLIPLVKRFATQKANGITKEPHPFFGKMSASEWDKLQMKHLDHHLRQFGV